MVFRIDRAYLWFHNHLLDPATGGRPLRRLPNGELVYGDEYEMRLREYEAPPEASAPTVPPPPAS